MARILINDGMHISGIKALQEHGHQVDLNKIPQEELKNRLQEYDAICVRSATKVRKELLELCPDLKVIARGGVGLDNIDLDYARSKSISVFNTPAASSRSVAELAFAHLFSVSRFLYKSNRHMPTDGREEFKALKKSYSKGIELLGKSIGIIGMGRIGQETAKLAMSCGMEVFATDPFVDSVNLELSIAGQNIQTQVKTIALEEMLPKVDVLSLHIPFTGSPVLSKEQFNLMKDGSILINASRGGTVNEADMLAALDSGKLSAAGIDVYENEPRPMQEILSHPNISCTPHIGASTLEAQEKIALELAEQLIQFFS